MTAEPLPIIDRMMTTSSAWSNLNPLMYLSGKGKNEQVQTLLSVGANPNLFNRGGDSALLLAAAGGHHDVVKTLLQKGANPNHCKGNKDNALLLALKGKHDKVVRALFESGKEIDKELIKAARKSFPHHPVLKKYLNVKVTRF
jgi:ankyrin repeat protein